VAEVTIGFDHGLVEQSPTRPCVVVWRFSALLLLACLSVVAQLIDQPLVQSVLPYIAAAGMVTAALAGDRPRDRTAPDKVIPWWGVLVTIATVVLVGSRVTIEMPAVLLALPVLSATAVAEESFFRARLPRALSRAGNVTLDRVRPPRLGAVFVSQGAFALMHLPVFALNTARFEAPSWTIAAGLFTTFAFGCLMASLQALGAGLGTRAAYHTLANAMALAMPTALLPGIVRLLGVTSALVVAFAAWEQALKARRAGRSSFENGRDQAHRPSLNREE
jgi:hypothetical protein